MAGKSKMAKSKNAAKSGHPGNARPNVKGAANYAGNARHFAIIAQFLVSAIIFALILHFSDAGSVISSLASSKTEFFWAAFCLYLAINLLMAYRMSALLSSMRSPVGFATALRCHFLGMLASDFTPARSGYFASAFALHSKGVPVGKATASILAPQLFDFFVKVFAAVVSIAYVVSYFGMGAGSLLPALAAITVIIAFMLIIVVFLFYPSFSSPYLHLLDKLPFGAKIRVMLEKLMENSHIIKSELPLILSILAATWTLKGMEWWMLSIAVGIQPNVPFHPLIFFMMLQPMATILQFIPTPTPAGAGLSEAGATGIMLLFGVAAAPAAAFAILTRGVMLLQDLVGLVEWRSLNLNFLDEKNW